MEALLHPVMRGGEVVTPLPSLKELQQRARAQLDALPPGVKQSNEPAKYATELTKTLQELTVALHARPA